MQNWLIGVDEAGEKAWVRSDLTSLRKAFSKIFDFEKVDSFCKKAFARGCLVLLELAIRSTDNLNSSCKEGALCYL